MSTYIYLYCRSHVPNISSDGEIGQHLYDLDDARKMIANKIKIVEMAKTGLDIDYGSSFKNACARFLTQHPNCEIYIEDEYGKEHSIYEELPKEPEPVEDKYIDIVFDGSPGPVAGRFVEVQRKDGRSISIGSWFRRADGLWTLRIRQSQMNGL